MLFLLLTLSSYLLSCWAGSITGRIQWNDVCNNSVALGPSKVVLDNGAYSAGILRDGSFELFNVPPGVYVLHVQSHDYLFDQLRVDVIESSTAEVRPYTPGTPLNPASTVVLPYPISLVARQKASYYAPPASFNLMGMLGSPMVLLMLGAGALMFATPYMMKNLDPESLEELKEQQAKMAKMQSAMASGDLKSSFSALLGGEEAVVSPSNSKGPTKGKGNKNKKR